MHGIPLLKSLLVASSILYITFSLARTHFILARMCLTYVATVTTEVALSSPHLWLLVVTTVFTEGGLGVNGNLLN